MTLTKEQELVEIRIINCCAVSLREDTIIKEDGVEISRSTHRRTFEPYSSGYDKQLGKWIHVSTDITKEDLLVKNILDIVWTDAIKDKFVATVELEEQSK